jgi:hypothetical protein
MAVKYDIVTQQRDTYERRIQAVGLNLVGATAKMQVKSKYGDTVALLTLDLTSGLSFEGEDVIVLNIPDESLEDVISFSVYDLFVTEADGESYKIIYGTFKTLPSVTEI